MVFNTVVGAPLPGVTCESLEEHDTISADEITPRQFQRQEKQFFMDAPGDTGKKFVTNSILNFLESKGNVLLRSLALLLRLNFFVKEESCNRTFWIFILCNEDSACYIDVSSDQTSK